MLLLLLFFLFFYFFLCGFLFTLNTLSSCFSFVDQQVSLLITPSLKRLFTAWAFLGVLTGMLDTSPPCHFAPISKFANMKFTIVIGYALILKAKTLTLNPNRKSQTKTLIHNLKSVTLCPNPWLSKILTLSP